METALTLEQTLAELDWTGMGAQLDREGFAVLPGFLDDSQVGQLADETRGGPLAAALRAGFYKHLVGVANRWNEVLGEKRRFPATLDAFVGGDARAMTTSSTTLLREGAHGPLHQCLTDDRGFPLQLAAVLNRPGEDFTGGEFVMVERRPRMQSRPIVVPLRRADVAIITTARRPHKGTRGYYRVELKHAVSRVRSGERLGWELLLHDAPRPLPRERR
jgi:hypothetical protein